MGDRLPVRSNGHEFAVFQTVHMVSGSDDPRRLHGGRRPRTPPAAIWDHAVGAVATVLSDPSPTKRRPGPAVAEFPTAARRRGPTCRPRPGAPRVRRPRRRCYRPRPRPAVAARSRCGCPPPADTPRQQWVSTVDSWEAAVPPRRWTAIRSATTHQSAVSLHGSISVVPLSKFDRVGQRQPARDIVTMGLSSHDNYPTVLR